ncbi:MAG: hypothetical protein FJ291_19665 [Planctomycetes bacterium]|nr:hypothetical protein [Planctomycetota bacterium]
MADEYLSFEDALKSLQMQEAELRALVAQGKLRAFRDENMLKFRRGDVDGLRRQREGARTTPVPMTPEPDTAVPQVVTPPASDEGPTDLLTDEPFEFDETADTIVGGDLGGGPTGDVDLSLEPGGPAPAPEPSTKVPTIELTAPDTGTEDTAVPTLDLGEGAGAPTGDTEVPTMVLGLDQYDDSQSATEDVATEEVALDAGELGADTEEATAPLQGVAPGVEGEELRGEEPARGTARGTPPSGFGTGEALFVREQASPLYTAMHAIAAFILLVPGAVFFYAVASSKVPEWDFLKSIMQFFWEQFGGFPPGITP